MKSSYAVLVVAALGLGAVSACNRAENAGQIQTSAQPAASSDAVAKETTPATISAQTAAATPQVAATTSAAKTKEAVLSVEGMSCMSCVATITRRLNTTPGVTAAKVDLEKSEARIEFDPAKMNVEQIAATINDLGYKAAPADQTTR